MYTGYLLTDRTRGILLAQFPPKYENTVAHHITLQFGVPATTPPPEMPDSVVVVGHIDSEDGVEGLLVEVNGTSVRPDKSKFHITWSLAEGRKAVETNIYVGRAKPVKPITISVVPKTFTK